MNCLNCNIDIDDTASLQLCKKCYINYKCGRIKIDHLHTNQVQKLVSNIIEDNKQAAPEPVSIPEVAPATQKVKIANFFNLPVNPQNFVERFNVAMQTALRHDDAKLQQDVVEIYRPQNITEIREQNEGILPASEIERIHLAREESICRTMKLIEAQGEHDSKSITERQEEWLTWDIGEINKKIAQLREALRPAVQKRNKIRMDVTEKLTPEERENFKNRARKIGESDSKQTLSRQAKERQKNVSANNRAAAKALDDFGSSAIKFVTTMYDLTEAQCENYIEKGEF